MFKKLIQQGRSKQDTEAYFISYVAGIERSENAADKVFNILLS